FSGDLTYYTPESTGGIGRCGTYIRDSDYAVAMNPPQYVEDDSQCGSQICITDGTRIVLIITETGTLLDRCAGCGYGSIDVTPPIFTTFAGFGAGRIPISWSF
ncbi:hypothetical protein BDR26DRAFT_794914, partial [Obelidium mucronatum]